MERQDELAAVLRHVHAVLERNEIWHCLMFGSLLGAVRDGDVIEWDHDLDLMIRPADIARVLALNDELAEEGLRFWAGRTPGSSLALNPGRLPFFDSGYLCVMRDDTTYGELYAPALFADGVLRLYDFEHEVVYWPETNFAAWFVDDLGTAVLRGERYPVPAFADDLLRFLYGDDWRVPYKSARDGGEPRADRTLHGNPNQPDLRAQIEWCETQGWDRSRYRGQPAWPRPLEGAGPAEGSPRTAATSRSSWWHTLDELTANH